MLSENIKSLRKQKGYSQEQLAEKLNVVRQTVSKWEKGYSVPDADMLEELADIFEVQVGDLLGKEILSEEEITDMGELVKQLTILNEYLAEKARRRKKALKFAKRFLISSLIIVLIAVAGICAIEAVDTIKHNVISYDETDVKLNCSLNGVEYTYDISYGDGHLMVGGFGEPEAVKNIILESRQSEKDYGAIVQDIVEKVKIYFTENGGTCEIIYEDEKLI